MSTRLVFEAGALEWALGVAALAAVAAMWPALKPLKASIRALRIGVGVLIFLALTKPTLHQLEERSFKPRLAVIVDQGPSMHAQDDYKTGRLKRAVAWLKRNRKAMESRAEVSLFSGTSGARRISFDELDELAPKPVALEPASVLGDVANAGVSPARVWLLSDGAFESGPTVEAALARVGAPVDALGVGPRRAVRAVNISGIESPDFVFIHSRFPIVSIVEAHQLEGKTVRVRLKRGKEVVARRQFKIARPFEVLRVTFTVEATQLGQTRWRAEADVAGENSLMVSREAGVEVIRQKYRIMYLAGRPSFEYSHLRAQLKADPNHELVSFVILRNPEDFSPVPDRDLSLIPFPAAEIFVKNLFQFDLFILENFAYTRFNLPLSYLNNLKRFVAQGGALLVLGGANAFTQGGYHGSPLEETLPVALWPTRDDFVPGTFMPEVASPEHPLLSLGETPQATAELWKALPPLDGYARFSKVRPGASVLLRHPTQKTGAGEPLPLVAVREFGRGKVMLVGTDSTWKWKLSGGRNWKISSFYARFWSRAVQYLTGSLQLKKVKFSPLPDRMPAREPAVLALHVFDEHFRAVAGSEVDLVVTWTTPDGRTKTPAFFEREPGVFQIELTDLKEGRHRVRAVARLRGQLWGEDVVDFLWESARGDAPLNRRRLKELADPRKGVYVDLHRAQVGELLERLPKVRTQEQLRGRRHLWAWSGWLLAAVLALVAEWLIRRRSGHL